MLIKKFFRVVGNLCLPLLATYAVMATAQAPDKIVYKGAERMLFTNPLEDYYKSDPDKRPNFMIGPFVVSTGNWRGYVASWEIADGKLFLINVASWICSDSTKDSCKEVKLADLFPYKVAESKIFANWFTGKLRVPDGEKLQSVHMGYGSTYERDLMFDVKSGIVSEPIIIDNTKKDLPSPLEAARSELDKLKESPLGNKSAFGSINTKKAGANTTLREPKSGIIIIPGQSVFIFGTKRSELEKVVGDGELGSKYADVYFVEYPKAGVQVSYDNKKDTVHVIFLYNNQSRYENFVTPKVKTDKGIDWNSSAEDILKAYGKPLKDFSDETKSWRRLEYQGIDFLFQGGKLGRIGILGPDGN